MIMFKSIRMKNNEEFKKKGTKCDFSILGMVALNA